MSERERESLLANKNNQTITTRKSEGVCGCFLFVVCFFLFFAPGCHGATTSSRLDRLTLCNKLEGNRINVTMFRSLLYIVLFI